LFYGTIYIKNIFFGVSKIIVSEAAALSARAQGHPWWSHTQTCVGSARFNL